MVKKSQIYAEIQGFSPKRNLAVWSCLRAWCVLLIMTSCSHDIYAQSSGKQKPSSLQRQRSTIASYRLRSVILDLAKPFDSLYLPQYRFLSFLGESRPALENVRIVRSPQIAWQDDEDITEYDIADDLTLLGSLKMFQAPTHALHYEIDHAQQGRVNARLTARTLPLIQPSIHLESGGGITESGMMVLADRTALLGPQTPLSLSALLLNRSEYTLGWQGELHAQLFFSPTSPLFASGNIMAHRLTSGWEIGIGTERDASTHSSQFMADAHVRREQGAQFILTNTGMTSQPFVRSTIAEIGYVRGSYRSNEFFLTGSVRWNSTDLLPTSFYSILDNTKHVMLGIQSISPAFDIVSESLEKVTRYTVEQPRLMTSLGTWIGHISNSRSSVSNGIQDMLYVGASLGVLTYSYTGGIRSSLHLETSVGSGFRFPVTAQFTAWVADVRAHIIGDGGWRYGLRYRHTLTGQWTRFRQLMIDHTAGLRGYSANALAGDNRLLFNTDLETPRLVGTAQLGLSCALFADAGYGVRTETALAETRKTANDAFDVVYGVGLRLRFPSLIGTQSVLRVDIPYNNREGRFSQVVLSLQEAIPLLTRLLPALPRIVGSDIERE